MRRSPDAQLCRRGFLIASGVVAAVGCQRREPETPLGHLYGRDWVHGAFAHYAQAYVEVEQRAQAKSFDSYKLLAQKGITALDGLQAREVPFYVRVSQAGDGFRIERDVPERLTVTAEMSAADRETATRAWKLAREHIHTDYAEIRRLDFALTGLLRELSAVRRAIDEGRIEQFRIVRQLDRLAAGGELPFALPYQVSRDDYQGVLGLLLGRLESDRDRLRRTEAAMIAVGLAARATDSGSASLAANVRKVLLAVVRDSEQNQAAAAPSYPSDADRPALLARSRELHAKIAASSDYKSWLAAEQEREDVIGKLLVVLDSVTGLPTSSVYRQVMRVWRGNDDYLGYLKIAVALVPTGSSVSGVLGDAADRTREYRTELDRAGGATAMASKLSDGATEGGAQVGPALINAGSAQARRRLGRQLAFFSDAEEARRVNEELTDTLLAKSPLPTVPPAR